MKHVLFLLLLMFLFKMNQPATWGGPNEVHIMAAAVCKDTGTHEVMFPVKVLWHSKNYITFGGDVVVLYGRSNILTENYTLKEIPFHLKPEKLPVFVYGKYKIDVSLIKMPDKVKMGCYTMTVDMSPKSRPKKRRGNRKN